MGNSYSIYSLNYHVFSDNIDYWLIIKRILYNNMEGKDMILSDFLSRKKHDDSKPHEIIPISFNIYKILHKNIGKSEKYLVQTLVSDEI